jgi:uncharacterized membrane protein YkoI
MRLRTCLLGLVLALALTGPATADNDQQRAREAMKAGRIQPLQAILVEVQRRIPGRILNAWLEQDPHGLWLYRLKMLDMRGNVVGVVVDARNGQILQVFGPRY